MNTEISSKLAALGAALMLNGIIIGGVAYLFNTQLHETTPATSSVQVAGRAVVALL